MDVIQDISTIQSQLTDIALTIGNYDGVHVGHKAILRQLTAHARQEGLRSTVVTFSPHPKVILFPNEPFAEITTLAQKLELFEKEGVDLVIIIPFTSELAQRLPDEFLEQVLLRYVTAADIFVGRDFAFGKNRLGDVALLERVADEHGYRVWIVDIVSQLETPVGSTTIRKQIQDGDVEGANILLGHPFFIDGVVEKGSGRGGELLVRTANLLPENRLLPKRGVYVTAAQVREIVGPSVTNIGFRPTFESDDTLVVESYLLDFEGELYGERLRLVFFKRLRDERRFPSAEELKAQIEKDTAECRGFFQMKEECLRDLGIIEPSS